MHANSRPQAEDGRGRYDRAVKRVAAAAVLLAGCVIHPYGDDDGVELRPLAAGWRDDLRVKPKFTSPQFSWEHDQLRVEITMWAHDPPYFMVYARNTSASDGRIRIRSDPELPPEGLGDFDVFTARRFEEPITGGTFRASGKTHLDEWIALGADELLEFWIDRLPWRSHPRRGERMGYIVEIERDGVVASCPLAFAVARVFRVHD
jgi:hypothetical protein